VFSDNGCERPELGVYRKKARPASTKFSLEQLHHNLLAKSTVAPRTSVDHTRTHGERTAVSPPPARNTRNWASLRRTSRASGSRVDLLQRLLDTKQQRVSELRSEIDLLAQLHSALQGELITVRQAYGGETVDPVFEKLHLNPLLFTNEE
jgi:hypothetical protein